MPSFKQMKRIVESGRKKGGTLGAPTQKAFELAGAIDKESFLTELADQWYSHVAKNADVETEVRKAKDRISKSGFSAVFEKVGITDEDLRGVITDIQEAKPDPVTVPKVNRNAPCPCGSGKKYKKCCGS